MRIALNIERVGQRYGGAESYAGALARWLAQDGHKVHVFARRVDSGELPEGVPIHWVKPRMSGWLGGAYQFAACSERALRGHQFDLIVGFVKVWYQHIYLAVGGAHPASLMLGSRRFRSRCARTIWWLGKALSVRQWVFRAIARKQFVHKHSPHIIAPSRLVAESFRRHHSVATERITVVYNALDTAGALANAAAARQAFRQRHKLSDDSVAVLFAARNYALKGLEPLLRAFAPVARKFPQASLVVCGSNRDNRYRRLARRLRVARPSRFLGFVQDSRECFAGCDLFALPTFYDPCSLVVLEAMSAGLPVVTTRQNGAGELLREGQDGFVVDSPWALDQLTSRLEDLIGDVQLRQQMGSSARARADEFSFSRRLHETVAAFTRAANDPWASPHVRDDQ